MKLMESAWAEFFLLISSVNVDVTIEVVVGIIVFLIFLYSRNVHIVMTFHPLHRFLR